MKRILGLPMMVLLCAGCRSPAPAYDPFLGRTTVEPPGTALPPPGQPYYGAPAGAANTPPLVTPPPGAASPAVPRTIGPANFSPAPAGPGGLSSSFSPNVSPISPTQSAPSMLPSGAGQPLVTPVSSKARPTYGPPGGFAYPQAGAAGPSGMPNLSQASPPKPLDVDRIIGPAGSSTPTQAASTTVVPATHWEPSDGATASISTVPAAFASPMDKSAIRIVEPPTRTSTTAGGATSNLSAPASRASIPGTAAAGTLNQSLAQSRSPEISELPSAQTVVPSSFAVASVATANSGLSSRTPSNANPIPTLATAPAAAGPTKPTTGTATSDLSRSSYGFDPQYHWLKGKLEYSQSTRIWRLRYIPPDGATDSYGGSVILADAVKLNGLNPGDFVTVQGAVGHSRADQSSFAPQYNLERIQKQ